MPRYIVERSFPEGLRIPMNMEGARSCLAVVANNARKGVTWVHTYVNEDLTKTFCVYDGANPEAIREAAHDNNLPITKITQVSVLDPYFYKS
jgi:hypothetical protein